MKKFDVLSFLLSRQKKRLLFLGMLSCISTISMGQTGYELAQSMFAAAESVTSMKFTMQKTERVEGELITQISATKLSVAPYKIYSNQLSPDKGLEVLYCEGQNDGNALINPVSFPWVTLRLDPMGSLMRKGQHHTIRDGGYTYVMSILKFLVDKYGEESKTMISKLDPVDFGGVACDAIELSNPYFQYREHTVQKWETLASIEDSLKLSGFMILEKNNLDQDYDEVQPGMTISVPTDYSPRMIIYIDQTTHLPVMMKIFDDQGLFELYEYFDIELNPTFNEDEFSSGFEAYGF
ncbi:LysM peptidoglycan-binding domain-containing protein [Reichenbachiella agariperforans]|uniref:LysM peptidoglycan-binding domain-containing protein n=1 Tax=Reichenbachiella agariperforans TaxID=156994 RepID=UPI001C0A1CF8|nr:DUF1571 domain-containing protein [Reichenbachiella agariperforans]MBU2916010.1 DUF1571 domain-containing protein [Reichenbachiella agariperforans]